MNKEREKTIVITGAGGFLGSNLVNTLSEKDGYFVYALSSHADFLQQQTDSKSNIQFHQKNVVFTDIGAQILEDAIVINCAFPRNKDGFEMADGLQYIQKLFGRAVECSAKAIINISSQSVYSQKRQEPATEKTPVCLENSYAVGKYSTELMLEQICSRNKTFYTNIRLASLIGPGFNQRIVNRLVEKALNMKPITIVESKNIYGFLDVSDAVEGIQTVVNFNPHNWQSIYNLGGNEYYSLIDIYNEIKLVFTERGLPFPDTVFKQSDERLSSVINSDRLFGDTGYQPSVTLKESIQKIIDWYYRNK